MIVNGVTGDDPGGFAGQVATGAALCTADSLRESEAQYAASRAERIADEMTYWVERGISEEDARWRAEMGANMIDGFVGGPDRLAMADFLEALTEAQCVGDAFRAADDCFLDGSIDRLRKGKGGWRDCVMIVGAVASKGKVAKGRGRAGRTGPSDSIYEQLDGAGNVRSRTFYDENGRPFSRQDFDHSHGGKQPHEHHFSFDKDGKPIAPESVTPVPPGYDSTPSGD